MSILNSYLTIALFLIVGCSQIQKIEEPSFVGNSYELVHYHEDTVQIEFLDNCVKNYNWDYRIYEEWKFYTKDNSIYLYFDGKDFELKSQESDAYTFSNNELEFKLIKKENTLFNPEFLEGKWAEEENLYLIEDTVPPPPPCPNNRLSQVPGITFRNDTCLFMEHCNTSYAIYSTNLNLGFIRIGTDCTSLTQWKIIKLTKDTLIIDSRYREQSEIKYEQNKKFIKYGS